MSEWNIKEKRIILILLLIIFLVFGIFFALKMQEIDAEKTANDVLTPLKISSLPTEFDVRTETERFQLKQINGEWVCSEREDLKLSYSKIAFMIETLKTLDAERIIEDETLLPIQCGLENPATVLEVIGVNGKKTYEIGDYNSVLDEYYVCVDDCTDIFMISADSIKLLNRSLMQLVDKPEITQLQINDISEILIETDEIYNLKRNEEGFVFEKNDDEFILSEYQTMNIYAAINSATYSCVVYDATAEMKSKYGLTHSVASITVKTEDGRSYKLKLAEAEDGKHYVSQNNDDVIYLIDDVYYEELLRRMDAKEWKIEKTSNGR